MKMINYILMFTLTCLIACGDDMPPIDPPPVEVKVFDLQWATKLDIDKELVSTDNTQQYEDWMLVGGDIGDPPIIKAFNKMTGEMDWEYIHDGNIYSEIDYSLVYENIYLGICDEGLLAIDLISKSSLWSIKFASHDYKRGIGFSVVNNIIYQKIASLENDGTTTSMLLRINVIDGTFDEINFFPQDDIHGMSPPIFAINAEKNVLITNIYPSIDLPQESMQHIVAVDLESGIELWRNENFTQNYASNGGHPPIIYQDLVITGGDWSMYAFDIHTGEQKWKTPIAPEAPFGNWNNTNHLIQGNRLFVNDTGNHVSCLDPLTGAIIWDSQDAPNCTDIMLYYEKEDYLVFTSWGNGSVMILDALTGETIHREHRYDDSQYNNDVVYDEALDMFFTSTYKHAIGFKINAPE